jgi:hypothetical protein
VTTIAGRTPASAARTIRNGRVAEDQVSSWRPQDLRALLEGDLAPPEPTVLRRADGLCLLYPGGRVSAFVGEPETLKSWTAQLAAAEVLRAGGSVLYVDFESEARDVVGHLAALGVPIDRLLDGLLYVRPDEAFGDDARRHLLAAIAGREIVLAVLDGVDNAMGMCGLEPNSRKEYAQWHHALVRPLQVATSGPVVLIDHVVKDREKRGDLASGAGNKKALVDGAMFVFELVQQFGRGRTGIVRLLVAKDRPGALRQRAVNGREIARLVLVSRDDQLVDADLQVPAAASAVGGGTDRPAWQPTALMERVSRLLEQADAPLSQHQIETARLGKQLQYVRRSCQELVHQGFVEVLDGPRNARLHRSLKPYREASP